MECVQMVSGIVATTAHASLKTRYAMVKMIVHKERTRMGVTMCGVFWIAPVVEIVNVKLLICKTAWDPNADCAESVEQDQLS